MRDFRSARGENGQLLLLAIILLSVGTLLVLTLLPQVNTMLRSGYQEREQAMARYAAEAALNRVVADLIRGADAYPTTYTTSSPHKPGQSYDTFVVTTSYSSTNVTINNYTASVTISLPTGTQATPSDQQNYVDPGVTNPDFATLESGYSYLVRLYNVKAGTIQVNWAYSPASSSRIGIWAGMPVDGQTGLPYAPGKISGWPTEHPVLDTGHSGGNTDYNRSEAITVNPTTDDSGGVYTIVFGNTQGQTNKTTAAYQPSGGPDDTWIYIRAYKDYIITATTGDVTVSAYVRQVPGFMEPPVWTSAWATDNPSFVTNKVYVYTWSPP